ncbi:MAG: DNA primase [Candidatus Reconcilbacillus cellulovorans]|uniref:DNA primase n=1 Tax=Candidatus Reconcilbacillus cellulovorans TaxID=1906605 RepID=A0A2A6E0J4_9BACL|nr:MAG: DNA primase [Candidatus Reconcilbacillus cellulovorans]
MTRGRISEHVVESVLKAHDIVEVVSRYVRLTKRGKYWKGLCPFHSEKTPSFAVTPDRQIFKCFGCGLGGTVITFIQHIENLSFAEAVRKLAEEAGISAAEAEVAADLTRQEEWRGAWFDLYELACSFYQHILKFTEEGKRAVAYLRGRGIGPEAIETFRIGFAPARWDALADILRQKRIDPSIAEESGLIVRKADGSGFIDRFRERIMFPIFDDKGRVVAFGGRTLDGGEPKYLNSPETKLFSKSSTLYNLHLARPAVRSDNTVVLFEGYVDVIQAWSAGERRGVASLGTALTEEQVRRIRRLAERVVLCYDGDSAGRAAALKNAELLESGGCSVRIAVLPDGCDPDEYIRRFGGERFRREVIGAALPSVKYRLHDFRKNFRLQEEGERHDYVRGAVEFIAALDLATEREHYVRELAAELAEFGVSESVLRQDVEAAHLRLRSRRRFDGKRAALAKRGLSGSAGKASSGSAVFDVERPDYWNAERFLLAVMMADADVAFQVQQELGESFHVAEHAALAAYLYAFYAAGRSPDLNAFMATLQDPKLEALAAEIAWGGPTGPVPPQAVEDCIQRIRFHWIKMEIERKKEEMVRAERAGDPLEAARIASEIISLESRWNFVSSGNV